MAKTAYDIIRKPIITEKSMNATAEKKYTFKVDVNANKVEIKKAVEEIFGVKRSRREEKLKLKEEKRQRRPRKAVNKK